MLPMHNPPHPGESLREDILPALKMDIRTLAHHMGYCQGQLSAVVSGRAGICADLAYRLHLMGAGEARMWLDMQSAYDLWQAGHLRRPHIPRLYYGEWKTPDKA